MRSKRSQKLHCIQIPHLNPFPYPHQNIFIYTTTFYYFLHTVLKIGRLHSQYLLLQCLYCFTSLIPIYAHVYPFTYSTVMYIIMHPVHQRISSTSLYGLYRHLYPFLLPNIHYILYFNFSSLHPKDGMHTTPPEKSKERGSEPPKATVKTFDKK